MKSSLQPESGDPRQVAAAASLLSRLLPRRTLSPREAFQARFVIGASLLALVVGLPSMAVAHLAGSTLAASIIGAYAAAQLPTLLAIRLGAPLRAVTWASLILLATFLTVDSLITTRLHPEQLKWLVLVPLASLVLLDVTVDGQGNASLSRAPHVAALVAAGLGCFIVVAHRVGLHFGQPSPDDRTLDAVVDHLLFLLAVGGLVLLFRKAVREAQAELSVLRSLLSVCAWCRRIREEGEWLPLERYIEKRNLRLTHGICPECAARHFPE